MQVAGRIITGKGSHEPTTEYQTEQARQDKGILQGVCKALGVCKKQVDAMERKTAKAADRLEHFHQSVAGRARELPENQLSGELQMQKSR